MLLFMDGVAHYDTSRIGMKYSAMDSSSCAYSVVPEGRSVGGNCIKRISTSNANVTGYLEITPMMTRQGLWVPTTSGVCGFAIKVNAVANVSEVGATNTGFARDHFFMVTESGSPHIVVHLNSSGTFSLMPGWSGVTTPIYATTGEGLSSNTWMYVEFKWRLHATAGTFEIRVNGISIMNYTGGTLGNAVPGAPLNIWNGVRILSGISTVTSGGAGILLYPLELRMCDLYLADLNTASAADVSDFLGDGMIVTILPNGVGSSTGWTPSAGANWDATNDRPAPDDDATYVATAVVNALDSYNFEDIPAGASVKAVHVNILARKETEGSAAVAPVVHQGSTDYLGPTQGVGNILYDRYITQPYDLNPATTAKFTAGEINAGEFGVKKVI